MEERFTVILQEKDGSLWVRFVVQRDENVESCILPISYEEADAFLISVRRFLAGAYSDSVTLQFAGVEVDFFPAEDAVRFHFGNAAVKIDGRKAGEFSLALRSQLERVRVPDAGGVERYRFVGVSPRGNRGCYYWYLDPTFSVNGGDYVWVKMGRHNTEQVVYVDGIRRSDGTNAPYPVHLAKRVLRKATEKEICDYQSKYE